MDIENLAHYGNLCAWALARAHARTGDPVAISGYLGRSDRMDRALATFAARYGAQTWQDHAALVTAAEDGQIEARAEA
jgi:thiamine monophosphate kinase